jgi:hypothetical protein|tara:strand:+ start:6582 stop:6983 length:402 start_codon:yes stop_codon:yes gene_type:complete
MLGLKQIQQDLVTARRRARQTRRALLVLNGASPDAIRADARQTRANNADDDETENESLRFEIDDPRRHQICWGSRNPCVWLLWILTRPIVVTCMVRRPLFSALFFGCFLVFETRFSNFLAATFTSLPYTRTVR